MTPSPRANHDPAFTSESSSPDRTAPGPRGALRVLVADDYAANKRMIAFLLERLGCTCVMVDDGLAALDMLSRAPFDVVILDMQMPELDGPATVRRLRSAGGTGPRPWVIALTGNVSDDDRQACFAAGMDDFLTKPISFPVLSEALERARRQLDPSA